MVGSEGECVNVVFLHPDLGIGGAERLIVDAALALKSRGHKVRILTAHHDPKHCFYETTDGQLEVIAAGDWLPRSVFGRCQAVFASVRMIYICLYLMLFLSCDVVFVDQVSTPLLLLHILNFPTLFYCHFPDLLLSSGRTGFKGLYRWPLDRLEEFTTGLADVLFVNSGFTKQVFQSTFKRLKSRDPTILYPSLSTTAFDRPKNELKPPPSLKNWPPRSFFLSINRYERKKNLGLAIESYAKLPAELRRETRLVIAGGYDDRVEENLQHYMELTSQAAALGVDGDEIVFLKSPSDMEKVWLLTNAMCLLYTPTREHFGIVPLEAMYCMTPVLAADSGGPTETVVDAVTGWLRPPNSAAFSAAMALVVEHRLQLPEMGRHGRSRVNKMFSFHAFASNLEKSILNLMKRPRRSFLTRLAVAFHFVLAVSILLWMAFGVPVP